MSLETIRERLRKWHDTETYQLLFQTKIDVQNLLAVATAACGIWHGQILHGDMTLLRNEGLRNLADAIDKMEEAS